MPTTERAPSIPCARTVTSRDVHLAVAERGDAARPTIVLVHGFPDTSAVFARAADALAERFHVVTYDVRGAGASSAPAAVEAYRLELLVEDLAAVIDATSPARPVHLVGHDWGSIQSWEAVTTDRLRGRIASFTTMSGPSLDHASAEMRRGGPGLVASQLLRSNYIGLFHLPFGPAFARGVIGRHWRAYLEHVEGVPRERVSVADTIADDAERGTSLYRANFVGRLREPRERIAHCPVQLLVARRDHYIAPAIVEAAAAHADRLYRRDLALGHWMPMSHPELVARHVAEFVDHVEGGPESSALRRARRRRDGFTGRLVVVTGGGGGIGRATVLAFARRGADVVVADIDRAAAERTAEQARALGVEAYAHAVDVGDEPSLARFAAAVVAEHGAPDVVVNNAGIGVAGPLLETSAEEWDRLVRVNLSGVAHGSRLFAAAMREAAVPGHVVNVASAAAFSPSRVLPAYSATKAAVKMLSECLRAELSGDGIGVSAICPGLVDTGITTSTRFAGATAEEQERKRRAAKSLYEKRALTAETVAEAIVRAVERDTPIVPVGIEAHALLHLGRLFPGLTRAVARIDPEPRQPRVAPAAPLGASR